MTTKIVPIRPFSTRARLGARSSESIVCLAEETNARCLLGERVVGRRQLESSSNKWQWIAARTAMLFRVTSANLQIASLLERLRAAFRGGLMKSRARGPLHISVTTKARDQRGARHEIRK